MGIKEIFFLLLFIVGGLCTLWGGARWNDLRQKRVELQEIERLRPIVGINYKYFDNDKIEVLIVAMKDNKETIDNLIVRFTAAGVIKKFEPDDGNIKIESAIAEITPTGSISILDNVIIKCKDVLPGKLYDYQLEFQKAINARPRDRITAVWFWEYKGRRQREEIEKKASTDEGWIWSKIMKNSV